MSPARRGRAGAVEESDPRHIASATGGVLMQAASLPQSLPVIVYLDTDVWTSGHPHTDLTQRFFFRCFNCQSCHVQMIVLGC